jgi:hypothetical protein
MKQPGAGSEDVVLSFEIENAKSYIKKKGGVEMSSWVKLNWALVRDR